MEYEWDDPTLPEDKKRVLYAIEAAMTLEACAEARNLRSAYLREHPLDWAVLSAANMLDAVERELEREQNENVLQPKLSVSHADTVS